MRKKFRKKMDWLNNQIQKVSKLRLKWLLAESKQIGIVLKALNYIYSNPSEENLKHGRKYLDLYNHCLEEIEKEFLCKVRENVENFEKAKQFEEIKKGAEKND